MLILPLPSRVQPVLELPRGSFVVLGPVEGEPHRATPLQKNLFATPHPVVFVVLESLRLVFVVLVQRSCFCCAIDNADAVPTFQNPLKSTTYLFIL
jgi:hypothetical protein